MDHQKINTQGPGAAQPDQVSNQVTAAIAVAYSHPSSDSVFARPLTYAPLVPDFILREHHCALATDTRFRAAARLLSALWREERGLPIGHHTDPVSGKPIKSVKLGSRITEKPAASGATFVEPVIASYARQALLFRQPGSVWEEGRLWGNLLSSQTLTLNLLAPMAMDLAFATRAWSRLLPDFVHEVTGIRFEHSPGRFAEHYFGDGTAFDALIDIVTPDGEPGFIAIEVKFVEDMLSRPATHRPRYDETTQECGLFADHESRTLFRPGFEQLRREHVMAQLMVDQGLASRGHFVLIGPRLNRRVAAAAKLYASELVDVTGKQPHVDGRERVGFQPITVEDILDAMIEGGADELAGKLAARYTDFHRVVRHVLERFAKVPIAAFPSENAQAAKPQAGIKAKPGTRKRKSRASKGIAA